MAISQETLRDIRKFFAYAPIIMPALIGLAKELQNVSDLEEEANKASERLKQKLEEEKQLDARIAAIMDDTDAKANTLMHQAHAKAAAIQLESETNSAKARQAATEIIDRATLEAMTKRVDAARDVETHKAERDRLRAEHETLALQVADKQAHLEKLHSAVSETESHLNNLHSSIAGVRAKFG